MRNLIVVNLVSLDGRHEGAGLGGGTPVLEGSSRVALRLLESRTLPESELVLVRYGPR
jgi:hypothetical protein